MSRKNCEMQTVKGGIAGSRFGSGRKTCRSGRQPKTWGATPTLCGRASGLNPELYTLVHYLHYLAFAKSDCHFCNLQTMNATLNRSSTAPNCSSSLPNPSSDAPNRSSSAQLEPFPGDPIFATTSRPTTYNSSSEKPASNLSVFLPVEPTHKAGATNYGRRAVSPPSRVHRAR